MDTRSLRAVLPLFLALALGLLLTAGPGARPAAAQFNTPTVDGTISPGEYGDHTDGQNRQTSGGQVWYMTWDDDNLYVGIAGANIYEGAILYLDRNPLAPINGGSNADGTIVGFNYDGTNFAALQFRADIVLYAKNGYREYRLANGANGWSGPTTGWGSYADDGGTNTREFALPWSALGGRPASFAWFGYLTSSGGYVYGPVPVENPGGTIGTAARYTRYYIVNNTGNGTSTKPFSRNCYVFNRETDIDDFGALNVYDFTMNTPGRTITRVGGAWTIGGDLRVDNGTVNFGAIADGTSVSGRVLVGSGGSLILSSAIGGDLAVGGNWTNNGTFNPNGRQVTFNGSGAQYVDGSAATTFDYLLIDNAVTGNVTLTVDITVRRELKVNDSSAELSAGSSTITLQGDATSGPVFWNNGTFNRGTGTVVFSGENNRNGRVLGSAVTTFNHVTLRRNPGGSGNFGVDFYDHDTGRRAHIAGILTLNQHTFVASEEDGSSTGCAPSNCDGTPFYDAGSTLRYNNSGPFDSAAEWWPDDTNPTCGTDKGMPYNVIITNSTALNLNAAFANNGREPNYPAGSNKTACGSLTIAAGSTLTSTSGILSVKDDWTRAGTFAHNNGTVRFTGSGGGDGIQTVSGNTTFYNLTLNSQSGVKVYFGSTTTTVVHDLDKVSGSGTMDPGTGKFLFTGTPSSILGGGQKVFYDLEIAGGATTNHTTGGSVCVYHSFVNNGTFTEGAGQDIYFNGGGNISLSGSGTTTFGSIWVQSASTLNAGTHSFRVVGDRFAVYSTNTFNGGTATVTFANGTGTALNGTLSNLGTYNFYHLTIETGAVVLGPVYGSKTINVAGNWENNGTFTHNSGTVVFNGTSPQTIGGSATTAFYALTINNPARVNLAHTTQVDRTLTLSSGRLTLGDYDLLMGVGSGYSGTPGATRMVVADGSGALCKEYAAAGSFLFPIGDATDTAEYSPATLDFSSGIFVSGRACVNLADDRHPNNPSTSDYLTRYWTVTTSGISSFTCTATFYYVDADVMGTEGNIRALRYHSGNWTAGNLVETANNRFTMTVNLFSDFTGGNLPLAVKLLAFAARPAASGILLTWETAGEQDNAGFNLYRSASLQEKGEKVNATLIPSRSPGGGEGASYEFLDTAARPGQTYFYTLEDVDLNGRRTAHGPAVLSFWRVYLPRVLHRR
ncbi:MAG: hypothetical protein ACP5OO_01210 [Chloroflexia bacterium]